MSAEATTLSPVVRRVLLGVSLSAIGNGLTLPLLVVYLGQVRGLGTSVAGFVVAYMAIMMLVLMPVVGIAVDRFGPRPALIGGLLVQGGGVALLTQVESTASAFAVASVMALGSSFLWSPQSALLGRLVTPMHRQRVFGIQFLLLNLGIGIGGLVAALVVDVESPATFTTLYLVDAATFVAYSVVLMTLRGVASGPAPVQEGHDADEGYRVVLRDRRLVRVAVLGLLLVACGYGSIQVGLPIMITVVNGLDVSWVAVAYAVNTMTIVVMQLVVLRLIQGRSRSRLLAVVALLWASSWLILGMSGLTTPAVAVVGACLSTLVFGLGETLSAPIIPSLVNDLAPDHLRGRYNSVQSLVWGVSGALGPAVAGLLLGADLVALWVSLVVGGCLVAGVLALRLRSSLTPELDGRAAPGAA